LETQRKSSPPEEQQYEYAADPFGVEEAKAKAAREKEKAEKEEAEKLAREQEKKRNPWDDLQGVHLNSEVRQMLEELIRSMDTSTVGVSPGRNSSIAKSANSREVGAGDKKSIVKGLVEKGFRQAHAEEAVLYCDDLTSALDWLCVYVPEDGNLIEHLGSLS
jgi:ATP-dependent RNA helicase DHX57